MITTPTTESTPDPKPVMRKTTQPQWRRQLRYLYLRFLRLQGTSEQLARGMASGIFSGCFPLFGFQILIGVAVATVLKGNRMMAAAATWISNPFTYVPIFAFNYQVGLWLLGGSATQAFDDLDTLKSWMDMGTEVSARLMLGSTVVGLVAGVASYFVGLPLIQRVRSRQNVRQQRQLANPSGLENLVQPVD
ncbi:DUF2062 domain-containing protein [Nodosilinea sp. FACHB-13]|uniref:DUF2062 domain-containing protein n=1 Tax=Cyanophyceae TaxID=3028117 RepID=UPI001F549B2E|nr:DUF2062 domain-containing protein [Nodosilinea sp. FACHB-13]